MESTTTPAPTTDPNDPHIADEDKIPEAPRPAPTRAFYMKVTENRAADDHEGGMVLFQVVRSHADELTGGNLVLSAKQNALCHAYPWKYQSAKAKRFFKVTIEEVDASELPPDPEAKPAGEQPSVAA
jgi:hypothetical protein